MEMGEEEGTCSDAVIDRTLIHYAARCKANMNANGAIREACAGCVVYGVRVHCAPSDALRETEHDPRESNASGASGWMDPLEGCCSNVRAVEEAGDEMGSDDGR